MHSGPVPLHPLSARLDLSFEAAVRGLPALADSSPTSWRDLLLALTTIHELHRAPIDWLDGRERFQHHPALASLKGRLEMEFLAEMERRDALAGWDLPARASDAMRAVGVTGLVPPVYRWLAEDAERDEIIGFLALEGGPDGGFDDLVAACQIGLDGTAKLELAQNYWDEMGNGSLERVPTELHRKLSRALDLRPPAPHLQPTEGLERSVLTGVLATNRWLQPELLGALGLLELQAGPRCRQVIKALRRIGAGEDALDFYVEHSVVDPRHGKDWVDKAVVALEGDPRWADGMVRGARWRSLVNAGFFAVLRLSLATRGRRAS